MNYITDLSVDVIHILKGTIQGLSESRFKELIILQNCFSDEITEILELDFSDEIKQGLLESLAMEAHVKKEKQEKNHQD